MVDYGATRTARSRSVPSRPGPLHLGCTGQCVSMRRRLRTVRRLLRRPQRVSSGAQTFPDAASQWRCVLENGREFYALASCPEDPSVDWDLRDHCLRRGQQLKPLKRARLRNTTRTMYANVFCAACHRTCTPLGGRGRHRETEKVD
ncbi:hypothetical protein HPB51_029828 [Rhipicephalus microplus]|uniref:Uncharacterized protein n=1 Tax=Rhipicephalus microplus TaxID=6941 RepID=A0A9J6CSP3_RHIMP|nr:hypothetical protein HPB51_029828 [Rhipicephalus microplus]